MTDPAQRLREIAAWVDRINPYVEEIQLYPNYEGPVDLRLIADQFDALKADNAALKDRVREAERNAIQVGWDFDTFKADQIKISDDLRKEAATLRDDKARLLKACRIAVTCEGFQNLGGNKSWEIEQVRAAIDATVPLA